MLLKGTNEVIANLRKYGKEAEKDIEGVTKRMAQNIEDYASNAAPANFGKLRAGIKALPIDKTHWKVTTDWDGLSPYAAYVEFGTGPKTKVPDELKAIAGQFKGKKSGSFKNGLKSIKIWCNAKGIDESAAFPILMSLIKNGQKPHPYLYPSLLRGRKEYLEKLEKLLSRYGKTKSK